MAKDRQGVKRRGETESPGTRSRTGASREARFGGRESKHAEPRKKGRGRKRPEHLITRSLKKKTYPRGCCSTKKRGVGPPPPCGTPFPGGVLGFFGGGGGGETTNLWLSRVPPFSRRFEREWKKIRDRLFEKIRGGCHH